VAKLSYLETILLEAVKYQSPSVDVLLVTDNTNALQRAVSRLQLPLNITYHQGKQPPGDSNVYWLTWEHRAAIEQAVARKNYSTVVYMEVCMVSCRLFEPVSCDQAANMTALFRQTKGQT
jgi:hypothetical protein